MNFNNIISIFSFYFITETRFQSGELKKIFFYLIQYWSIACEISLKLTKTRFSLYFFLLTIFVLLSLIHIPTHIFTKKIVYIIYIQYVYIIFVNTQYLNSRKKSNVYNF